MLSMTPIDIDQQEWEPVSRLELRQSIIILSDYELLTLADFKQMDELSKYLLWLPISLMSE